MSKEADFFRAHLKTSGGVESFVQHLMQVGQQNVHTPFSLCREIVEKLTEYTSLDDKKIAVLFNIEFAHVLMRDFGVKTANLCMFADDKVELEFCRLEYGLKEGKNLFLLNIDKTAKSQKLITSEGEWQMKFDVVIGNPPYQAPTSKNEQNGSKGSRNTIWQHFVVFSLSLVKENGYLTLVHPARWRKPDDHTGLALKQKEILYLEMHSKHDGMKTFGALTNYDWYLLRNAAPTKKTVVKDYLKNVQTIDISALAFIPNFGLEQLRPLLAGETEERCEVIFSRSAYGTDRANMREAESKSFRFPCVHSTTKDRVKCWYSNTQNNGHFGIPKVIFGDNGGDTGIFNAVVDQDGIYGLSQHAIGLPITSPHEGKQIKTALESLSFTKVINSCQYGGFQIDWRMFKYFKADFWKHFLPKSEGGFLE